MAISAVSGVTALASAAGALPTPVSLVATPATSAASIGPTDTITLSAAAQAALVGPAAPASASVTDVGQALATLNDTSRQASVTDQLNALSLVSSLVASGAAFTGAGAGASQADLGAALVDSAFSQHLQSVVSSIGSYVRDGQNGANTASSLDNALNAFNALSAGDQRAYVGALNIESQAWGEQPAYASVADYQANQQAKIDVTSALDAAFANPAYASQIAQNTPQGTDTYHGPLAALSKLAQAAGDTATAQLVGLALGQESTAAWTAKAQAYFAQNGPAPDPVPGAAHEAPQPAPSTPGYQAPDSKTLMAALLAVNDNSGKTSLQDQISSYKTLLDYTVNDHSYGVARGAIVGNFFTSAFLKRAAALDEAVHGIGNAPRGSDPAQTQLDRINKLSPDDLQIDFGQENFNNTYASVDCMKANYAAQVSYDKLMDGLQAKYGVGYAPITNPAVTKNPAYLQLLALPQNQHSDAWTAQFQKLAGHVQALLDAGPSAGVTSAAAPSASSPTQAEQALATLQAPPSTTSGSAIALNVLQASDAHRAKATSRTQKTGGNNKLPASTAQKSSSKTDALAAKPKQQTYTKGSIYNGTS